MNHALLGAPEPPRTAHEWVDFTIEHAALSPAAPLIVRIDRPSEAASRELRFLSAARRHLGGLIAGVRPLAASDGTDGADAAQDDTRDGADACAQPVRGERGGGGRQATPSQRRRGMPWCSLRRLIN